MALFNFLLNTFNKIKEKIKKETRYPWKLYLPLLRPECRHKLFSQRWLDLDNVLPIRVDVDSRKSNLSSINCTFLSFVFLLVRP